MIILHTIAGRVVIIIHPNINRVYPGYTSDLGSNFLGGGGGRRRKTLEARKVNAAFIEPVVLRHHYRRCRHRSHRDELRLIINHSSEER